MQDTCLPQNYVNCIKVKVCGCRRFRKSVLYGQCLFCSSPCLPLSYFLLVRLSCSFPPEVLSRISLSAFCILLSFPPLQFSPVSSVCLPLSFLCFIIFSYYNVRARVCGDAASFASLQVCLPFFRLFLFSVCCFRMGPFLFPSLYARANIIMCLSFSSRVLRYKNMLCNTSVIQSITKKFQEIRIIFPSYVCWLSLKGLPLHPQSREMRHFRQCVTDLVKQTQESFP